MNPINANARLLIVDDDAASISLLESVAARFGCERADILSDQGAVFSYLTQAPPDLVLLSLDMAQLDGLAVMQHLATMEPWGSPLPVLALTADQRGEIKTRALAAGAADLLIKPHDPSEVFMRMRNVLQMRSLHRQLQDHNQTLEAKVAERTRELRESQQQIIEHERLRAFGEMAGGVVHDFNNALMSVVGYSEILLSDDEMLGDIHKARRFLKIMNTAGHEASHSIGRLRDFYRPREVADLFRPLDLNELLEEAVPLTQPKWKGQALAEGRTIAINLDLAKVPAVLGNLSELREIARNLIFNAVDALSGGGTITLRSDHDDRHVWIEVIDTGAGMGEEVRRRCLDPFFSTKGNGGTGLGLSMVFGIVKRHDAVIEIESELGRGTTVRVRFPAHVKGVAANGAFKIDRSLRVLVVDDEPVSRCVLERYLIADGHTAETAVDAEQAIARLISSQFDLLITDHAMPGMNGVQLAAAAQGIRAGQPVILVTGFAQDTMPETPEGIDTVVRKPVPRQELQRALLSVMGN